MFVASQIWSGHGGVLGKAGRVAVIFLGNTFLVGDFRDSVARQPCIE